MSWRAFGGKVVIPNTLFLAPPRSWVITHWTAMFIQPSSARCDRVGATSGTRTFCGCESTTRRCFLGTAISAPDLEVELIDVVHGERHGFADIDDAIGHAEVAQLARRQR